MSTRRTVPLVALAAVVIQILRLALAPANAFDRVWAEDAEVFLADAQQHGWHSIFYSYAGYGHLVPRMIGMIASTLPLSWLPLFSVLISVALVAVLTVVVYLVAVRLLASPVWALMAALLLVVDPAAGYEDLGAFCNLQWFMIPTALWLFLDRPTAVFASRVTRPLTFVIAASAPLVVLVAGALLVHRRGALRHPAALPLGAGLAVTVGFALFAPTSSAMNLRHPRVNLEMIPNFMRYIVRYEKPHAALFGLGVLAASLLAIGMTRRDRERTAIVLGSAALCAVVPSVISGSPAARYVALSTTVLFAAAIIALRSVNRPRVSLAVGTVVAAASVYGAPLSAFRVHSPTWSSELRATAEQCRAEGSAAFAEAPAPYYPAAELRC